MSKKLIKKCLPGDIIVKSDNTRVASPVIEEKPIYIQPQSKQTYVSADYRSPWLLQQDLKKAEIAYNTYIDEKNKELALQHALGLAAVADAVMLVPDITDLLTKGIRLAGKKYLLHKNAKLVSSLLNGTPTITPIANNVGWGPRYTGHVVHKSKSNTPLVLYNPKRWDVVNEGANPHGVWYLGEWGVPRTVANATEEKAQKAARARAIFEERPYTHEGELVLEKPIITVGDVPDRSALSYQADALGADGLIYNNVYDNGYNNNQVILSFKKHTPQALVKWYGPTMGKTTASKTNSNLVDIDPLLKPIRAKHAERLGLKISDVKVSSDPAYKQEVADFVLDWRLKPENKGKTLVASTKHLLDPKYKIPFDNNPVIPDLETFIARNKARGFKESEEELRNWYNSIFQQNDNIQIDNRFVSDIESKHKTGGRLVPKHAKGSPVNTNPLPEMHINTNPVPKKEDKKKLIKRCKLGDTVERSDNTRVQMPRTDVLPIYYEPAALVERAIRKLPQAGSLTPVYPEFELLMGLRGLSTSFRPKKKLLTRQFKDKYGREVIPTPYNGPDSDLIEAVSDSQKQVLRDYFSEDKINQIKKTMGWGDSEISELLDEIIRAIGNKSDVRIKGPLDGFTIIGEHKGKIVGSGPNAEGVHMVTLNRERVPNLQVAQETGIHEIGVHGKTLSMQAEDFGKAGYSDYVRDMFPRLALITLKNADIADEILEFNRLGNYLNLFKTTADLERYFVEKGIPFDKWDKFNNNRRYFNYVNQADEKTARAYTGLLYEKVYGDNKTENIQLLEKYFTPESVERFKKAVLSFTPIGLLPLLSGE